jgi:hypothetical protein
MLDLVTAVKERQVLDAKARRENLDKMRDSAQFRLQHYLDLLGDDSVTVPAPPTISSNLTADSQLPADTTIPTIQTDVDQSLVDTDESGVKIVPKEKQQLDKNELSKWITAGASLGEGLASFLNLIPQVDGEGTPLGVGVGAWWGGQNLGPATSAAARAASITATFLSQEAAQAGLMAGYIRREQDWTLQANMAAKEIVQLDKQITSADIQVQVAEKELDNHLQQIENAKEVELFLQNKFTNQELYQWLKEQLFSVYKQSYNLAFDLARKAEKAYQYETGIETTGFIQYGYWDNAKQGLVSGEKLQLALRQLEKSYFEVNRRELELSRSISLDLLDPLALIELKETGTCYVSVPEELFDFDFPGHYFRRIKAVSLTIPCVAGPYTSVNCSLRLLSNYLRINTAMNSEGKYEHENDEGLWIDDDRFRSNNVPVASIVTSTAQNDAGLFEFNFRDERYLPFEGAGAISTWQIELAPDSDLRQFDYDTVSDVILQFRYTAKESGGLFKENAVTYIRGFVTNPEDLEEQPLLQGFSMKHDFPSEWYRFLHPDAAGGEQVLSFTLGQERFPFFTRDRRIVVMKIDVLARCSAAGDYNVIMSLTNLDGEVITSSQLTLPASSTYGGLKKVTLDVNAAGLNLDELDIGGAISFKLKRGTAVEYTGLVTDPPEVDDLLVVFHYKLADN